MCLPDRRAPHWAALDSIDFPFFPFDDPTDANGASNLAFSDQILTQLRLTAKFKPPPIDSFNPSSPRLRLLRVSLSSAASAIVPPWTVVRNEFALPRHSALQRGYCELLVSISTPSVRPPQLLRFACHWPTRFHHWTALSDATHEICSRAHIVARS